MKFKPYFTLAIILIVLAFVAFAALGAEKLPLDAKFLNAIHQVESSGKTNPAKGDNGAALGAFQIHYAYWKDSGVAGSYSQCADIVYSRDVMTGYMNRYGRKYIRDRNFEALARLHNSGPNWKSKIAKTDEYWRKVKSHL